MICRMDFQWKFILCNSVILLSNLGNSQCLIMKLYPGKSFAGLNRVFELNGENETACSNFPNGRRVDVESVRTDKCVILYMNKNCTTPKSAVRVGRTGPAEWSRRFDKDTAEIPQYRNRDRSRYSSFHVCSQAHGGGPQLDLDIYDGPQRGNSLIMKYRGVCNCRNIPASISINPNISVDMHGNKVEVFSEENCEGTSHQLGPQDNLDNRFLRNTTQFAPRSFKPVGLDNCYRLHADIYKFHIRYVTDETVKDAPETKLDRPRVESVKFNFRPLTYYLGTTTPEKVLFSVTDPITKLLSVEVNTGFEVSAEKKIQMMILQKLKTELKETYKWDGEHGYSHAKTTTIAKFERRVRDAIPEGVPLCSFCTTTPDVKRARKVTISYDLYTYIRGWDSEVNPTAAEIRQNLPPGMTYIRDCNEHTVVVRTNGTMFAELAVDVVCSKLCGPARFGTF